MYKKYIILCLFVFFFCIKLTSQCTQGAVTTFQKVYGGASNERAHSIQSTVDGGYIVVGETTSFGAGNKDWFVMKINANGVEQWSKTYGSTSSDDGNSITIKQTSDLGYIVAGHTESFGAGSFYDSYIIKLDNLGNIQWEKRIPGSSYDAFRDIIELSNGDFLATGSGLSFASGNMDAHMVRISPTGNLVWIKNLGTIGREHSQTIIELPGGGYLLGGNTNVTNNSSGNRANAFLIKTDNNGNVIFGKEYNESTFFSDINEVILLNDGNFLCVGETRATNSFSSHDIRLLKTDTNGTVIWSKKYSGPSQDVPVNVREKANGELVISGFTESFGNGNQLFLMATDNVGNVIWSKIYGGTGAEETEWWGKIMELTSSNEIILAGGTRSFGAGNEDVYIVKTNECGESFCNEQNIVLNGVASSAVALNFNVLTVSGSSLVNTTTIVNTINFTDNYLCVDTILIVPPCNLTANFSNTTVCLGDSSLFTDLSTDSLANIINWQWYFGNGDSLVGVQNPSYLYNTSGTYNVTLVVTNDSNCIDSITITLTVNPVFAINLADTICQGDSIFLGGAFQTTAGNYIDSLQSIFGCDSIITTTVMVNPSFSITQNSTLCQGDSILFNGNSYSATGIYIDSFQTILGCDSLLILNLIVNPTFQINQNLTICQGDSALFGGLYQTTPGIYYDTLQTQFGCDSILASQLLIADNFIVNISSSICEGESIFIGGSYQTLPGIYTNTLLSQYGCDSIVNTTLSIIANPIVDAYMDTAITKGQIVQLNVAGATSYQWSPPYALSCVNCSNPIASPYITTEYIVKGTVNGCSSFDTVLIIVNESEVTLYVPNTFTPDGDGVNDKFYFYATGIKEFEVYIFDRWGEMIYKSNNITEGWDAFYKGKIVQSGVYVYRVRVVSDRGENIRKTGSINVLR